MTEHVWGQLGKYDSEGYRTFTTPGDICQGCSDPESGLWVPVSSCPEAWAEYLEFERALEQMRPEKGK